MLHILLSGSIIQKGITAFLGFFASRPLPGPVLRFFIRKYIRVYSIDMSIYDIDIQTTKTFNEFFTRALKPGQRTFTGRVSAAAEGYISAFGEVKESKLFQVKGDLFSLETLLGSRPVLEAASFVTIYLSPADYHRVHMPFDGTLHELYHIPGKLHSVNPKTVAKVKNLYCRNERVVMLGSCSAGKFALVLVGALVVGNIRLSFVKDPLLPGNRREVNYSLGQGDELGCFQMGSTLLLIMETNDLKNLPFEPQQRILLGQALC